MTIEQLQALLHEHDDGVLRSGAHEAGREFCALEFEAIVRGRAVYYEGLDEWQGWSDEPVTLPDLRPLNDAPWSSDEARTAALLQVMVALWNWSEWSSARRTAWASRVAINTVREIVSELPSLSDEVRVQCRAAMTLPKAEAAAKAAWAAAEARAAGGAESAASEAAAEAAMAARAESAAAEAAAEARAAGAESVLLIACRIWIRAAEETA